MPNLNESSGGFQNQKHKGPRREGGAFEGNGGNLPGGQTGDWVAWRLIAQLSPGPTPRCRATMEDKMARGIDLTLQMSFLLGVERTIYVPRLRFC